jgi:hypothetical protein
LQKYFQNLSTLRPEIAIYKARPTATDHNDQSLQESAANASEDVQIQQAATLAARMIGGKDGWDGPGQFQDDPWKYERTIPWEPPKPRKLFAN